MAFSDKYLTVVVLALLMLLVVQPAYSGYSYRRSRITAKCQLKCHAYCLFQLHKRPSFRACLAVCFLMKCGSKATDSHPSFQCGVGCVKSKCSNSGDGNEKVSEECVTSCVNSCDEKITGHTY